jgi:hypothetical protein
MMAEHSNFGSGQYHLIGIVPLLNEREVLLTTPLEYQN